MARTKGALNKRTRAALHAVQTGEIGGDGVSPIEYLLKVVRDSEKPDAIRIEAAKAVAPYLQPKLCAVDLTNHVATDQRTQADILAEMKICFERDPATKSLLAGLVTEMAVQIPNQRVNEPHCLDCSSSDLI